MDTMKTIIIFIAVLVFTCLAQSSEIMIVAGDLDFVSSYNGECSGGNCGTPEVPGGDIYIPPYIETIPEDEEHEFKVCYGGEYDGEWCDTTLDCGCLGYCDYYQ